MGCAQDTFKSDDVHINLFLCGFDVSKIKPCQVKLHQQIYYRSTKETHTALTTYSQDMIWIISGRLPRLFEVGDEVNLLYNTKTTIDGDQYQYIYQIYHIKTKTLYCP